MDTVSNHRGSEPKWNSLKHPVGNSKTLIYLRSLTSPSFLSWQPFIPSFSYFYHKSNKNKLRKQVIVQTCISSLSLELQTTYSHPYSIQMSSRQLKFNTSNTELLIISSPQNKVLTSVNGNSILPTAQAKNPGVSLVVFLSHSPHPIHEQILSVLPSK